MLLQQDQPTTGQELPAVIIGRNDYISSVLCNGDRVFPTAAIFKSGCLFELVPRAPTGDSGLAGYFKTQCESTACPRERHLGKRAQEGLGYILECSSMSTDCFTKLPSYKMTSAKNSDVFPPPSHLLSIQTNEGIQVCILENFLFACVSFHSTVPPTWPSESIQFFKC